jgi:hypothetical protein
MDTPIIEERQAKLGEDLVWGAEGIATELDVSIHRARYLIRTGKLPITRISERPHRRLSQGFTEGIQVTRRLRHPKRGRRRNPWRGEGHQPQDEAQGGHCNENAN